MSKQYYSYKESDKFCREAIPHYIPTEEDMATHFIDEWFEDHEIVISIAGKVISIPYNAETLNCLYDLFEKTNKFFKGEQEND